MGIFLSRDIATLCPNFCWSLWLANTKKNRAASTPCILSNQAWKVLEGHIKVFRPLGNNFHRNFFLHRTRFSFCLRDPFALFSKVQRHTPCWKVFNYFKWWFKSSVGSIYELNHTSFHSEWNEPGSDNCTPRPLPDLKKTHSTRMVKTENNGSKKILVAIVFAQYYKHDERIF